MIWEPISGFTSVIYGAFLQFFAPAIKEANISPVDPPIILASHMRHAHTRIFHLFLRTLSENFPLKFYGGNDVLEVHVLQYFVRSRKSRTAENEDVTQRNVRCSDHAVFK